MEFEIISGLVALTSLGFNGWLTLRSNKADRRHEQELATREQRHLALLDKARAEIDLKSVELTEGLSARSTADEMVFQRMKDIISQYDETDRMLRERIAAFEEKEQVFIDHEKELQKQIDALRDRVASLEDRIGKKTEKISLLHAENEALKLERERLSTRLQDAKDKVKALNNELTSVKKNLAKSGGKDYDGIREKLETTQGMYLALQEEHEILKASVDNDVSLARDLQQARADIVRAEDHVRVFKNKAMLAEEKTARIFKDSVAAKEAFRAAEAEASQAKAELAELKEKWEEMSTRVVDSENAVSTIKSLQKKIIASEAKTRKAPIPRRARRIQAEQKRLDSA